ncbi:universal stress protein [bacterium]|nr:universal stress protein [bacterium]
MNQFKNILLIGPTDKRVVAQAVELLTNRQSKMTLLSLAPSLEEAKIEAEPGKIVDLQLLLEKELIDDLSSTAAPFQDEGVRIRTKVVCATHPFVEVIRQVVNQKHDLVMMLADGVGGLREQLFGTLSMHLMRKCPCPVWVVKPSRRTRLRNVFAAVDPDPNEPDAVREQLNIEILSRATTIAQNHSAKLHVIHAWTTLGDQVTRSRRWMSKTEIRLHIEKVADRHRTMLNRLLADHSDGSPTLHMLQGRPGQVIPETISQHKGDLLVMGTVCRTGIPGFFIGNTAETILSQVDCSVLTVKPNEFVSPVRL